MPDTPQPKLLVIDNYDSFTYNLVQMFTRFHLDILVQRSDKISTSDAADLAPDYLLISPGPKDPAHAGVSMDMIRAFYRTCPHSGRVFGHAVFKRGFRRQHPAGTGSGAWQDRPNLPSWHRYFQGYALTLCGGPIPLTGHCAQKSRCDNHGME